MPTYDYLCTACNHEFEVFQSIKAEPLKKCGECGKPALKRLIGAGAAVVFKGSGFYQTDYKKKPAGGGEPAAKKETKPAANSAG